MTKTPPDYDPARLKRSYCFFMNSEKYFRNWACKKHDNAYGIYGGGSESDRRKYDRSLYNFMKEQGDPLAFWAYFFTRIFGWFFFNYHEKSWLWRGQLVKKIFRSYRRQ